MAFMNRRPRRRRRRHYGGNVLNALSALAPIGKGAALSLARVLGKRAVKVGKRAAMGAAASGVGYGVRRMMMKRRRKKRRQL